MNDLDKQEMLLDCFEVIEYTSGDMTYKIAALKAMGLSRADIAKIRVKLDRLESEVANAQGMLEIIERDKGGK